MLRTIACVLAVVLAPSLAFAQLAGISQPGTSAVASQAPARDSTKLGIGMVVIRGRVLAAETGRPLRKAQIRATMAELAEARTATTDDDGRYELSGLPSGRYVMDASKSGYLALAYGQLRAFEPGKPIEIADGQITDRVDFSLPRGGVIAGRVLDEFGDPVPDVRVMAMRHQYLAGRRQLGPAGGRPVTTNDIGEFRLFGLPPGQYYVAATPQSALAFNSVSEDRSAYAPAYYPGTSNPAEAQRITIGLGQIVTDISMMIIPVRTVQVSGTAVDSQGRPLSHGIVSVMNRTIGATSATPGAQVRPDGSFTLSGLAPGEYTLRLALPSRTANAMEFATAVVAVANDDVTGVLLAGSKPSTATGRIIVDSQVSKSLRPAMLSLGTTPVRPEDGPFMAGTRGKVNDDFTFELKPLPGVARITLFTTAPNWTLKAVRLNGVDVTDTGIEFKSTEYVSGIEIELTNRVTEVSGVVTDSRGQVKDYSVVVFGRDPEQWRGSSRYLGAGRPDQNGRFKIRSLAPGDYYAIALDYVDPGDVTDPEFLERLRPRASAFSLSDGETKVIALKLVREHGR